MRPRRRLFRRLVVLWPVVGLLAFDPHAASVAPPEITVTITGAVGLNGWYTSNVTVDWQVDGETSSSGCDTVTLSADTPGTTITCTAANGGDQTIKSVTIKLDKTPPSAAAAAERAARFERLVHPASHRYLVGNRRHFRHGELLVGPVLGPRQSGRGGHRLMPGQRGQFGGNLALIQVRRDRPHAHRLEDQGGKSHRGTRVEEVGRRTNHRGGENAGPQRGRGDPCVPWSRVQVPRQAAGGRPQVPLSRDGLDDARNRSERAVDIIATGALLRPRPGQQIAPTGPLTLRWIAVKRASYYNVQVIRNGKILSVWPTRSRFQLRRTWVYKGHRYRLRPGVYHWYVWPGFGRFTAGDYGRLLGSSTFVVPD